MNINFDSDSFQKLLSKAKIESKSIPAVVNEIIKSDLINEEINEEQIKIRNCS